MIPLPSKEILKYLADQQDEMLRFLRQLVLVESPSSVPDSQAPILSMLFEALQDLDFNVQLIAGRKTGGHILARAKNQSKTMGSQLLLGHCDTVWPMGTLKDMAFYIEGNVAKGPGVFDMKGGLTHIIFALRAIRDLGLKTTLAPIVFVNSDEEIGSVESSVIVERLAHEVQRTFVLEPSLGLLGNLKTARKGVGRFEIVANGRAAHAGLEPEKGISAVLEISYQIQNLFAMNDLERGISVNVGTIEGGLRPNVVAPTSKAIVDVRVPSMEYAVEMERAIYGLEPVIPEVTLMIKGGINRPPLERTPANRRLWILARELGESLGLVLEEAMAGGGSDGNTTSQFTATLDGLGAVGDGAHARHEFIFIDKMIERCALLVLLLTAPTALATTS